MTSLTPPTLHERIERLRAAYARLPGPDAATTKWALDELQLARTMLLALAVGAHGEKSVDPAWVVQLAVRGLGVGRSIP